MIIAHKTIIISGTSRNVGKTTFACQQIAKYKEEHPIAIKISSHFHDQGMGVKLISFSDNYRAYQQIEMKSNKDSALFLKAGAKQVFYIEAKDEYILEALSSISDKLDFNQRIIIESAAIRRYMVPQEFILLYNNENPNIKEKNKDLEKFITSRACLIK